MREQTIAERLLNWLKNLFTGKKKTQENSDEIKREMCKKAVLKGKSRLSRKLTSM